MGSRALRLRVAGVDEARRRGRRERDGTQVK